MKNKFGSKKGFTLFELLVVILLVAVVGGISTMILVSSLRSSDKTNSVNEIRASGNYAITQMTKMIKYAKSFDGLSVSGAGNSFNPNCAPNPNYKYLKITSIDRGETTFACRNNVGISSNSAMLIDTAAVKVSSCNITCTRDAAGPPTISIDFILSLDTTSTFYEKQASIPFHTSVTMRNY